MTEPAEGQKPEDEGKKPESQHDDDQAKGGQQQQQPAEVFDRAYVEQLRQEAAANRKRAADAEAKVKQFEDASKSDLEKAQAQAAEAQKRADAAEATAKTVAIKAAVLVRAGKKGIVDPDGAYALMDKSGLDLDESGGVDDKAVDTALEALVKAKPYLLGTGGGASAGNGATRSAGSLTLDDVKKMTPDQINENWTEVEKTLAAGK